MRYEGMIYRPPSEAGSLLIQATVGCPHNKCAFCSMYKGEKFRIRPVEEIKQDLATARDYYGEYIETLFFPDGNTIIMKTDQLVEIFEYAGTLFPHLQRITVYGSAKYISKKSVPDLKRLKASGLKRVHTGMESGDDIVLQRVKKGTTAQEIILAGNRLKEVGIEVSEYYLAGIGGRDRSKEHALNSARVLNAFSPDFIRLRTFVPQAGTPIYNEWTKGDFQLLTAHETLREVKLLIENLHCHNSIFLSDHMANYCNITGSIPGDKDKMINSLEQLLTLDASVFRPPHYSRL